jgi:AcrR family transcriptional regulator
VASSIVGGGPAQERTLRAQGRRTMQKLLDAAIVVFGERGYYAARVDDICEAARTSHGTFYLYFSSKDDLFRALLADVSEEMLRLASSLPAISAEPEGFAALRAWLASFYDLYLHFHPVIQAWMETEAQGRMGIGVLGSFADLLVERIESPTLTDPKAAALAAVAMVERFSYYSVVGVVSLDREQVVDTLAIVLHAGVFGATQR